MIGHLGWLSQRDSLGTASGDSLRKPSGEILVVSGPAGREWMCLKAWSSYVFSILAWCNSSWLWGSFWGLVGTLWGLLGTSVGSSLFVGTSGNLRGFSVVSGLRGIGFTPGVSET